MASNREDKILDVAIALAEKGGFDNVRQRDVAAQAGVALGTLYKRFRSKEDILVAALERESQELERRMDSKPARGDTPAERVTDFFSTVTRALVGKPNYARAILRAMASGQPHIAGKIVAYYERIAGLIIAALRGTGRLGYHEAMKSPPSKDETQLALMLQSFWFASLVGWSAGLHNQKEVIQQMRTVAELLVQAVGYERK
jgi:AcrR family transcriptional regulator